jgi:phosphoglycerate dehydrogenase-like enzyme
MYTCEQHFIVEFSFFAIIMPMKKLVITQPMGLTEEQIASLKELGDVKYFDDVCKDTDEWLERVKGADVIYSNSHGLEEGWQSVKDTYITLPFVGFRFMDIDTLKKNNVMVSNSPGCNQVAVAEWVVAMLLNYSRKFPEFIKVSEFNEPTPVYTRSIYGKTVCVMGKGAIGSRVGSALEALGMRVDYYTRKDNLIDKIQDADFIVDCLSLNPSTIKFYDDEFFAKTKDGAVFLSIGHNKTQDIEAIIRNLETGKIQHFITDNASALIFDVNDETYRALLGNPSITITPHVAAYSDNTMETASKMCIENIKAYLAGSPINLIY